MKHTTHRGILLGIGLLGASALMSQIAPVSAQPRNNPRDNSRDNSGHQNANQPGNNKPSNNTAHGGQVGNTHPGNSSADIGHPDNNHPGNAFQGNTSHEPNHAQNGWDNSRPEYNRPDNFRPGSGWQRPEQHPVYIPSRPVYIPSRPLYTGNESNFGHSFERDYRGTVTKVRSDQSFDIDINGNIFNVYTLSRIPRSLSVGDWVRVSGVQQYSNDIRNADVTILNQR